MSQDPTGRYQGKNYDPEYNSKQKWRQKTWNKSSRPSHAQPYKSRPDSPSLSSDHYRGGASGMSTGTYSSGGGDFYNSTVSPDPSHPHPLPPTSSSPYNPPPFPSDTNRNMMAGHSRGMREDFFYAPPSPIQASPNSRAGGNMERQRPEIKVEPNLATPSFAHAPDSNNTHSAQPVAASSNTTTLTPTDHSPAATATTATTPTVITMSNGEALSSLEKLRRFKAQVEATRRPQQQQQQPQQQPSSQQLEKVRIAESFLSQSAPATPTQEAPTGSGTRTVPPSTLQPSNNAVSTPSQQPVQATPAGSGEDGEIADSREAREHLLKEKLRLKMAQRAAGSDPSGSRPASSTTIPAGAQPPINQPGSPAADAVRRQPREDVEMADVQARPNGHSVQPPGPREGYPGSRREEPVEPPFDHRNSYAAQARQRLAKFYDDAHPLPPQNLPRANAANRLTHSPPPRRGLSPRRGPSPPRRAPSPRRNPPERHVSPDRSVRRTPPPSRDLVSHPSRHERASPAPEYSLDRGRPVDRRPSYSSVSERRVYERQPSHYGEAAGAATAPCVVRREPDADPPSYLSERAREREYERDAQAMPPPAGRPPLALVVPRDDTPPSPTNPMEAWAISQVKLLKQQQEGVVKAIAEFEKMISSGILRSAAPTPTASAQRPLPSPSASVGPRVGEYRQEYRQEARPEQRMEQRMETRMEPRQDPRLEHGLSYSDQRSAPPREPSPGPFPQRSFDDPRDARQAPTPRSKPPYGAKEYEYGGEAPRDPRGPPADSYGKAPAYKSYDNYTKQKPYDRRPYDASPTARAPSPPPRSQYGSQRRNSYEGRAPPPKKYDYRY